jgi:8-oxo-dGTP pyrophosphatase MutT (NUDIX family)
MKFQDFISNICPIQNAALGGLPAHLKMAPNERRQLSEGKIKASNPKQAAVLALFYPDNQEQTRFLLTLRASYKGVHSAQISFPGGKKDKNDTNSEHTALRETYEEVGIEKNKVEIIKQLTPVYIPPSNFLVAPFMGFLKEAPVFTKNNEVETLIEVKLSELIDEKNAIVKNISSSYMDNIDIPCFKLNNYIIWGATAMILSDIKYIIKTL